MVFVDLYFPYKIFSSASYMKAGKVFVDIVVNYVLDLGSKQQIYPYKGASYFRQINGA